VGFALELDRPRLILCGLCDAFGVCSILPGSIGVSHPELPGSAAPSAPALSYAHRSGAPCWPHRASGRRGLHGARLWGVVPLGGGVRRAGRRSGPTRGGQAPFTFSAVNRFCMACLHGRAGRMTVRNGGGLWRAQSSSPSSTGQSRRRTVGRTTRWGLSAPLCLKILAFSVQAPEKWCRYRQTHRGP
jgi:hypothetical protein